jgi:hypothetical protein
MLTNENFDAHPIPEYLKRQGFGLRAARRPSGPNPRRLNHPDYEGPTERDLIDALGLSLYGSRFVV